VSLQAERHACRSGAKQAPPFKRNEAKARAVEAMHKLQEHGVKTFLAAHGLGRGDVELMRWLRNAPAAIASIRTGDDADDDIGLARIRFGFVAGDDADAPRRNPPTREPNSLSV
jgi:hypothetical protein